MRTFFNVATSTLFLSVAVLIAWAAPGLSQGATYALDVAGRPVASLGDHGTRAVVLWFISSDCPVSNRTFPEMKRLRERFTNQGVRFWFVYANADESPEAVQAHQRSYDAGGEAILDTQGKLARLSGAKVTPEAAVLVQSGAEWKPVYVGRIDNRYVKLGLERPYVTEHFTERVLEEVLTGKPIDRPNGKLVGCGIVSPAQMRASQ